MANKRAEQPDCPYAPLLLVGQSFVKTVDNTGEEVTSLPLDNDPAIVAEDLKEFLDTLQAEV